MVTLVMTRNVLDYTYSVTEQLQSNAIVKGFYLTGSFIDLHTNVRQAIDDKQWYHKY